MSHVHARWCPVCGRGYERKGRWGHCNGPVRHQFDIYTLATKRRAKGGKRRKRKVG